MEVQLHVSLASALIKLNGQLQAPATLLPREREPGLDLIGLTSGLGAVEKRKSLGSARNRIQSSVVQHIYSLVTILTELSWGSRLLI